MYVLNIIPGVAPGLSENGCPAQKNSSHQRYVPKRELGCRFDEQNFEIFKEISSFEIKGFFTGYLALIGKFQCVLRHEHCRCH